MTGGSAISRAVAGRQKTVGTLALAGGATHAVDARLMKSRGGAIPAMMGELCHASISTNSVRYTSETSSVNTFSV